MIDIDKLKKIIKDNEESASRNFMYTATKYYKNESDITTRKRQFIGRNGQLVDETRLSNTKLPHPFFAELVDQKVSYLLGNPLSISTQNEKYHKILTKVFSKDFLRLLKGIAKDAIVYGISWIQAYYNEQGELHFKRIPSTELVPQWDDIDHTRLSAIIRHYFAEVESENDHPTRHVEYYNAYGSAHFIEEFGELRLVSQNGHFSINKGSQVDEGRWGKIPFIPFKYNTDEISLLKWIKPLLDNYDIITSDISNTLLDTPHNIKILRGYNPEKLDEFAHNLAIFRMVAIDNDGDITTLSNPIDTVSSETHLARLRKDIWEAGRGVDTQETSIGNASGVALRFRYSLLDMDCSSMAAEFASSIDTLLSFVCDDLKARGLGDYSDEVVDVIFNTDIIINESETISDIRNSMGIISHATALANHPYVTDVNAEQERINQEASSEDESLGTYDFGH